MSLASSSYSYPLLGVFWTIFIIFLWVIWFWIGRNAIALETARQGIVLRRPDPTQTAAAWQRRVAIITTVDPLVSIGVAYAWLGETINSSPPALAGEIISLAVTTFGVFALAHRAPHVMSTRPEPSIAAGPAISESPGLPPVSWGTRTIFATGLGIARV
jgi:HAMP domain-containing protein